MRKAEKKIYDKSYSITHSKQRRIRALKYYNSNRAEKIAYARVYRKDHKIEASVRRHLHWIFGNLPQYRTYRGMPIYRFWNPKIVGIKRAVENASLWIRTNIGESKKGSLHILPTGKGFRPGNLVWAGPLRQSGEQMAKTIAKLQHQVTRLQMKLRQVGR